MVRLFFYTFRLIVDMLRKYAFAGVYLVLVFALGCGSGGEPVNYVEGTVSMDGAPLADATVSFSPIAGGTGKAAVGMTDAKGVFKLSPVQGAVGAGASAGDYEVSIVKDAKAAVEDPEAWKTDPNYGKETTSPTAVAEIKSEVPAGYSSPSTSGLVATVKSGSNTGIKFELKKDFGGRKR